MKISRVVGLVSGGKDSCFNMMKCVENGHEIVCLANLRPPEQIGELDSYMYQSVGNDALKLYSEAMNLPLYQRTITGTPISLGQDYKCTANDEVEDLYELLLEVKTKHDVDAVSVGAIFSDYQRVRVEDVCERLGLKMLAYLWHREQGPLMQEMIESHLHAIIIKVAVMGLLPDKHLGLTLEEIYPEMIKLNEKFGLNICGEGGEFESLVLDCPLFQKRIVVDEKEIIIHSEDAFAPVGYLRFKKLHLEDKETNESLSG